MQNTPIRKKKSIVPSTFKFVVAISSVAGTIGIWNFLANKDLINAQAQNLDGAQSGTTIELPPLPTIVPLVEVQQQTILDTASQTAATAPALRNIAAPQPQVPVVTNNNNTSTGSTTTVTNQPVVVPTAVTTTQTSKPK